MWIFTGFPKMEFENNWVYPWPDTAYDPVLKVRMWISNGGRDAEVDDVSIRIEYDPQIEAGRYTRYRTDEERIGVSPLSAGNPLPFSSKELKNITDMPNGIPGRPFHASNEIHGSVRRIKMYRNFVPGNKYGLDPVWTLNNKIEYIKENKFPVISQYPKDFLLYALRNYIGLSDLNGLGFPPVPNTAVTRIEMCFHADVMTRFFNLRQSDYEQVEAGWYCISALELTHGAV
jgi:hypothetical protein